jgi:hypothetical protein
MTNLFVAFRLDPGLSFVLCFFCRDLGCLVVGRLSSLSWTESLDSTTLE